MWIGPNPSVIEIRLGCIEIARIEAEAISRQQFPMAVPGDVKAAARAARIGPTARGGTCKSAALAAMGAAGKPRTITAPTKSAFIGFDIDGLLY